jgi:hypothetical protein
MRPERLQATHAVAQAVSQQTPSAQLPEAQLLAAEHAWPFLLLQLPVPSHA